MTIMRQNSCQHCSRDVDWSILPPELLHLIYKKLPDLTDIVRFRAVCTRWLSAAPPLSDLPPLLPWLLVKSGLDRPDPSLVRFYSVSSGRTLAIDMPQASKTAIRGPSHGYILTYNWKISDRKGIDFSLVNPLTKKIINLPSFRYVLVDPYVVHIDPQLAQSVGYVVVNWGLYEGKLAFCRPGDKEWITLEDGTYRNCRDAFYNGMYFTIEDDGVTTKVIDIPTRTVKFVIPPTLESEVSPRRGYPYLIVSGGEILKVFKKYDDSYKVENTFFDIHRLVFGNGDPCWVKTNNIGEQMLFLDYYHGLSVKAIDFAGFRGNCIYFLQDRNAGGRVIYYVCRYDIQKGITESLPGYFERGGTWFVPSLC